MSSAPPLDLHPHDVDAEKAVLGSLLIDNEVLPDVASVLGRGAFYVERHRVIYDAITRVYDAGGPVDLVTLTDNLRTRGRLEGVGGAAYLVGLAESTPTAAYARHYAGIVAQKAVLRDIITTAQRAIAFAAGGGEPEGIISAAQAEITSLLVRGVRGEFEPSALVASDTAEYVDWLSKNRGVLTGLTSGLPDLDRVLHGFQPGSLYVVAARPSMGKTALALKCAYAAAAAGAQVAVFSLEMPNRDLGLRIACAEGRVDSERVRRGELNERDWQRLADALGRFANTTMHFNDIADLSMNELRAKARALAARNGVSMIVVDYLQLLSPEGGDRRSENRVQEVGKMSRGFKLLARELDVPVILLSQLSRQVEGRPNKRPLLSDLRESGSIEQDADVVLFLYRDDYYDPESADVGIAEIIVGKNRNGALATVKAMWSPAHASFESLTTRQDAPPTAPGRFPN